MVGTSIFRRSDNDIILTIGRLIGPPSQSLGVDPADPAVMRKPPRKKNEDLITRRVIGRIVFSATVIVFATLFVYATALSDSMMSHRDQTMVSV